MKAKLTITIDESVIDKAKQYAKNSGRSLSDLIESYLQRLISDSEDIPVEFKDLFGSVKLPAEMDDKTAIRSILSENRES